jgi:protein-S-isoprenylcysteine O-methyltransferase Ste14
MIVCGSPAVGQEFPPSFRGANERLLMSEHLLVRAVVAFVALPGVVAGIVPWYVLRPSGVRFHLAALPLLIGGGVLLLLCVRQFYVTGRGTLAPWSPPTRLVAAGLYRYSRNPMYVSVLLVLAGWAMAYRTAGFWTYLAFMAVVFHLRVCLFEEPWLRRTFGEAQWRDYARRVPRWLF